MNNINDLLQRIEAETSLQEERRKRLQREQMDAFARRQQRYRELFLPALHQLNEIWTPRLELLAEKVQKLAFRFGESISVTRAIEPGANEPHFGSTSFVGDSSLAAIRLKFGYYHDADIRNLVVDSELKIIPVFLQFEREARLEQPLEAFNADAAAQWLDDRIVNFVRTYLAIHENAAYVADQIVEDPIAHVRFPRFAAETTLQKNGTTYYFISPETKREFQRSSLV